MRRHIRHGLWLALLSIAAVGASGCSNEERAQIVKRGVCQITASALPELVGLIPRADAAAEVMQQLGPGISSGCELVIDGWMQSRTSPQSFELLTSGGSVSQFITLEELMAPAEVPSGDSMSRIIDCYGAYPTMDFLYRACTDGIIDP